MQATQDRMNIFTFSPELRNLLYEVVLDDHSPDSCQPGHVMIQKVEDPELSYADTSRGSGFNLPALLQTSRQIRGETQELYFARSTFVAQVVFDQVAFLEEWILRLSPSQSEMVKKVVVEFVRDDVEGLRCMAATRMGEEMQMSQQESVADKPRNVKDFVLGYLGVDGLGIGREVFEVKCVHAEVEEKTGLPVEVMKTLSGSLLFCLGCGTMGEPEEGDFTEEVCEYCREEDDGPEKLEASSS